MTDRYDPNDPLADIAPYDDGVSSMHDDGQHMVEPGPYTGESRRSPLLTGLVLGLLLVVVSIAAFQLLGSDDGPTTAAPETTLAPDETATTTGGTTDTTVAAGTGETTDSTSTSEGDGTGDGTSTAATPYEAVGEAIPIAQLQLAADGVGDIEFGSDAADAVGRLVASLGDPEEDTGVQVSDGSWGTCVGENERIVRWGPFAAIVVVDPDGTETFAAYRHDLSFGGLNDPTIEMATLSGLLSGSSYRQLEQIYADFDVSKVEDENIGPSWQLKSVNTGNLLLWGPLSVEDIVRGIYSPDACGRF